MPLSRTTGVLILLLGLVLAGLWQVRASRLQDPGPLLLAPPAVFVGLSGAVPRPGIYAWPSPPPLSLLLAVGGWSGPVPPADQPIATGDQVEVHPDGQVRLVPLPGGVRLTLALPVDLNRASAADLEAVPGLGPVLARRIVAYREDHGPWQRLDQLLEISGIGADKLVQISPYLTITQPRPAALP